MADLHASLDGPGDDLTGDFSGNLNSALGFSLASQYNGAGARFGPVDSNADFAQFIRFHPKPVVRHNNAARLLRGLGITDKRAGPKPKYQQCRHD